MLRPGEHVDGDSFPQAIAEAVEAQDVALVEVHAHHVGALSGVIAVGETSPIPSCRSLLKKSQMLTELTVLFC